MYVHPNVTWDCCSTPCRWDLVRGSRDVSRFKFIVQLVTRDFEAFYIRTRDLKKVIQNEKLVVLSVVQVCLYVVQFNVSVF